MKKRIPSRVASNATLSPQPTAEAELRGLIGKYASAHERLIDTVRRWLRKRLPAAHEVVYEYKGFFVISYSPSEHGYEGVFAVRGDAEGVRLYFNQGKVLPDPDKLLQGSAQARFISVAGAITLKLPAVVRLYEEAMARNRVSFARTGRGAVIIRSTAVKSRRKRSA